jgi:hypothetical protein
MVLVVLKSLHQLFYGMFFNWVRYLNGAIKVSSIKSNIEKSQVVGHRGFHLKASSRSWRPGSRDEVSWTICPGWPQTAILLISASQVARITGMGHWCLALTILLIKEHILFQKFPERFTLKRWVAEMGHMSIKWVWCSHVKHDQSWFIPWAGGRAQFPQEQN